MSVPIIRRAQLDDLPSIVRLLANDGLGQTREDSSTPLRQSYVEAFSAIEEDPNQFLGVLEADDRVVGTFQLTFIPSISRMGALRAQIEAVRIDASLRGSGVGHTVFEWIFRTARQRGCALIQLTCDKARPDAHRFYESLGFVGGHTGFKKIL